MDTQNQIELPEVQRILLDVIDEFQATIDRIEQKLDAIQTKQQVRVNAPIIRCIIDIGRLLKEFPKTKIYEPKKDHAKIEDSKMVSFFVRMDNALFIIKSKLTVIRDYIKQCKSLGNALALTLILNDIKQILDTAENPDASTPVSPSSDSVSKPFSSSSDSNSNSDAEEDNNTQDPEEASLQMTMILKQRRRTLSNSQDAPPPFLQELNNEQQKTDSKSSQQSLQVPSWTNATPTHRMSVNLSGQKDKLKDYIEDMLLFDNSLRKLISDPKGNQLFMEFLMKNHCEENLLFWHDANEYRKIGAVDKVTLSKKFYEIYDQYVKPDSPKEVNLTSAVKKSLKDASQVKNFNPSTFEEAQKNIFVLMENDPYRRFALTDTYKQYQANLSQGTKNPPRKEVLQILTGLATEEE